MKNRYPFIFVHGMLGWGERELFYKPAPYWGMVCGNLMKQLRSAGYEAYAPKVGPMNSAWDRACELYALLTGTRVDYGKAHSEQKHHERFGRTYEQPLFPGWGSEKKVHLLGHSFGGATIRLLTELLTNGDPEERDGDHDLSAPRRLYFPLGVPTFCRSIDPCALRCICGAWKHPGQSCLRPHARAV